MTNSENDALKKEVQADTYEDEIDLMDYFLVLWRRKWFIFLASVLPALIVGLAIFLWPRDYKVTYVYNVREDVGSWNLNEKNYNVLLSRFYSEENLNKLINKLKKNGFEKYAKQLDDSGDPSREFVKFEAIPPFLNLSKLNVIDPQPAQ